jgi:hypothetical protein
VIRALAKGRGAAENPVGVYRAQQLLDLLERVREGFAQLDAGVIDVFELDELIHRYGRCARELRRFCGSTAEDWDHAARTLARLREQGEEPDWWEAGGAAMADRSHDSRA